MPLTRVSAGSNKLTGETLQAVPRLACIAIAVSCTQDERANDYCPCYLPECRTWLTPRAPAQAFCRRLGAEYLCSL